ncbi:serine hydrolase domain-containing protein [Georgenia soli]|uniref:serine hydrolase domain-containing protein n=1 Tax=Georgenia soli TaxID=638953 RepID=UPI001473C908|nr:serine hydrolase domain-containing protein [Georgenia soli]
MTLLLTTCGTVLDEPPLPRTTETAPSAGPTAATTTAGTTWAAPSSCGSEPRRPGPTLQEVLDDLAAGHAGGLVVAVGRDGEPVRLCAAGRADTRGTPLRPDDAFRIGSITKTFTAVMVLQLVDAGAVALDDPVSAYLPDAPLVDGVTVRQLLNHSSGIPDYAAQPAFETAVLADPARTWTPEDSLAIVEALDRDFPPGTQTAYSNTNFVLAGLVVEKVTGRSLAENLRTRITGPLGLGRTALPPGGPEPVTGFSQELGTDANSEKTSLHSLETAAWAAGGMVSTAQDLTTFFRALAAGELLSAAAMGEMTDFRGRAGFGLGLWRVQLSTGPGYGHGGSLPGFKAFAAVRSESGDVLVVLANEDDLDPSPYQFSRVVFRAW